MNRIAAAVLTGAGLMVLFGEPVYAVWAAVVALASAWILDPSAVRSGFRFGVVLAVVFAAALTTGVVAWSAGLEKGAVNGAMVLLRLLVLTAAAAVVVRNVDADRILDAASKAGFDRLGLVLGLALNTFPRLVEAAGDVWMAHSLRSRTLFDRVRRLPGLGVVLLAHTARIAEEAAASASLRGHSALTRPGVALRTTVRTVVLTGAPNGGKTSMVLELTNRLRDAGVPVFGFAQVGVFEDESKVGFRIRDLATGDETGLARRIARRDGEYGTGFVFSAEGFALGRTALARTAAESVVIVDELGPVELRGEGHMEAVKRAMAVPDIAAAVVVVRRSLVPSLVAALEATDVVVIDVTGRDDDTVRAVLAALELGVNRPE